MCGLLAYLSTDADRADDATVTGVREALHCMRHRGPDENAVWSDSRAVFGFNRLSFIDIEHSHQPMPYADGRYRIVFNGEIYNYVELREELIAAGAHLATEGDTETIVAGFHLWGEDVVSRLRGMFAFVIWDSETGTAFGARDPFGIKPLFTTRLADGGIVFSSEKKALLELLGGSKAAGGVDSASLQHYLTLQYVPEPATLHRGIRRIESGTSFRVVDGELHTQRYFHPTFPIRPVAEERAAGAVRPDRRRPRRLGAGAHACRRHRRRVPLRRHRLDGHRRAGQALQPEADDLHDRVRAGGLLGDRRRRRVGRGHRGGARHQGRHGRGVRRGDPAGRLVPRRPGGRSGARAAVLHRPRGPQAREGRALRRGRRRTLRWLQHLPGTSFAGGVRQAAHGHPPGPGPAVGGAPGRDAGQGPPAPRIDPARAALLRQRADLPGRRARASSSAATRTSPT